MATLSNLSTGNLALKGAGTDYNYLQRFFATKAEADAALADGSWTPTAGKLNGCLTGDQGLLVYNEGTSSLDLADAATRAYIDSQISALVDGSPGTLDTLNELAAAINDNPNYFTDAEAARAANTSLINAETARATAAEADVQAAAQAYVDQQIATDMWLFADQAAFPPAADNHGRVVHSHADAAIFYAHGGMWHKIENESEAEYARGLIQSDVDSNEEDRKAVIDIESNITSVKNAVRGTSIQVGNNIALHPAPGGRVEIEGDLLLDNQTDVIDGAGVTLTSFTNINAYDGRLATLEADPTTAAAVAAVQADVDQNEVDSDAAEAALGARIDNVESEIDTARTNLYTALGRTEGATEMGTFTGSTLGDGQTIKVLLQQLETATETEISDRQAAIADILNGATFTGDIVFGALARIKESGNELKIQNDSESSSIVLGPKISLQPATGSRIELYETVRMPDGTDLTVTGAELNYVDGVTSNVQDQLDAIQADVNQNESDADAADTALSARLDVLEADPVTKTYVDTEVANLIDAAPGALDTLNELAASIGDDSNFAATVTNQIAVVQADVDQNEADADAAIAAEATTRAAAITALQADVDQNEADADAAIALRAPLASPTFTGLLTSPAIALVNDDASKTGLDLHNNNSNQYAADVSTSNWGFRIISSSTNAGSSVLDVRTGDGVAFRIDNDQSTHIEGSLFIGSDELTATGAELNYVDGVTSNVQDQLDAIQADVDAIDLSANTSDIADIRSVTGTSDGSTHLGNFSGSNITDGVDIKTALQELSNAIDGVQTDVDQNESDADAAIAAVLAGTSIPGPYADDTAAASGGVAVGAIYKETNGTLRWRVS